MSDSNDLAHSFRATVDGGDMRSNTSMEVLNPSTGRVFATVPAVAAEALDAVFASSARAFSTWRGNDEYRRERMRAAGLALHENLEGLAASLTSEQGKPLADARDEITWAIQWLRYFTELELPREILRDDQKGYEEVIRRPVGVVAAIAPWNFPVLLAMWKVAPALRAGNTVVLKPSPYTPLTTLAIGYLMRGILPDGVLNVIAGPEPLGAAMVSHHVPRKVGFTGSIAVGKQVALAAAPDLKRVTLELGGNDPAIVLDDVDVAEIAKPLFWGAFQNNGQVCLAVKRVYAHEKIKAELVEALGAIAARVRVADGFAEGAQLGPVNNAPQLAFVEGLVEDAVARGARVVHGGTRLGEAGYFYSPTVLDGVADGDRVVDEEQFGPVLPVVGFSDEDEAVARANGLQFGLTASVWSADPDRASALARQIDSGQVSINAHGSGVRPHLPFGGHKWSGIGVENGRWGLYGFTELQTITGPPRESRPGAPEKQPAR